MNSLHDSYLKNYISPAFIFLPKSSWDHQIHMHLSRTVYASTTKYTYSFFTFYLHKWCHTIHIAFCSLLFVHVIDLGALSTTAHVELIHSFILFLFVYECTVLHCLDVVQFIEPVRLTLIFCSNKMILKWKQTNFNPITFLSHAFLSRL